MTNAGHHLLTNIPVLLYLISITLHLVGICLLNTTDRRKLRNQDLIIMNLSAGELSMSAFDLAQNLLLRDESNKILVEYLTVTQCALFVTPCFLIMILLTMDRFAEVYFNIKYAILFSKQKVVFIIILCWIAGLALAIPLLVLKWLQNVNASQIIYRFVFPSLEALFLIVAALTYSYIYKKYRQSRQRPSVGSILPAASSQTADCSTNKNTSAIVEVTTSPVKPTDSKLRKDTKSIRPGSLLRKISSNLSSFSFRSLGSFRRRRVFRKKNFFVPSLIIITFIIFVIVPDLLNLFLFYITDIGNDHAKNGLLIMYALGFIADAIIYIFLQRHIRNILVGKLRGLFCTQQRNDVSPSRSVSYVNQNGHESSL